ncbi:ABC transporter, partial [candidate division KSB1 bacterium]
MIQVEHLTKRYGKFTAVDDISFCVNEGEVFAFLGPNGSGKTTTMKTIVGLNVPTSGRVLV